MCYGHRYPVHCACARIAEEQVAGSKLETTTTERDLCECSSWKLVLLIHKINSKQADLAFYCLRDVTVDPVLASPRQPGSLLIAALSLGQMVTVVQQLTVTDTALEVCELTHDQIEKGDIKKA